MNTALVSYRIKSNVSLNFKQTKKQKSAPPCTVHVFFLFLVCSEMNACLFPSHTLSSQFPLSHFPVLFWTNLYLIRLLLQILLLQKHLTSPFTNSTFYKRCLINLTFSCLESGGFYFRKHSFYSVHFMTAMNTWVNSRRWQSPQCRNIVCFSVLHNADPSILFSPMNGPVPYYSQRSNIAQSLQYQSLMDSLSYSYCRHCKSTTA